VSAAALAPSLDGFNLAAPTVEFLDDPYPTYDALRRASPLHWLGPDSVLLTRYDDVLAIYRSAHASSDKRREFAPKFGADSPLYEHHTTSLVFNDPPLHTRVRRILMGALDQRAIARMETGVRALVHTLLDGLEDRRAPDLIEHFAAQIPVEVIGNLLDVPREERGPLRGWSLATLSALEPAPGVQTLERGNAAVTAFKDYLTGLIDRRRRSPGDPQSDVLTRLIHGDSQGQLSQSELMHNCIFLLNAGHETTTNLIGNGAHALLAHRDQFERLVREPAMIGSAVEELLRFESPLQLNNRLALAPIALGCGEIPADTFVTLGIGAANRDPSVFDDPHRLDIGRRPNNHLAFGQGSHACSGMNVARMEARIALGELVRRFPRTHLADSPPERDRRVRFRGLRRLPVRLT
jgi:cytochrome P450